MVERCATGQHSAESVLATLARDAGVVRAWKPGGRTLAAEVGSLPSTYVAAAAPQALGASLLCHREVMQAVPDDLRPVPDAAGLDESYVARVRPAWASFTAPLNRYLAAKAFASWTAYQGRGIATIVRGLEVALALVRVEASRQCREAGRDLDQALLLEAIRRADFALNHLAVGEDLADAWSSAENVAITGP